MGFQDRIRKSLTGGGDSSDPPEYRCNGCQGRFNSNRSPRHARCPECDSDDVELLANPDRAEGSHPLDPRSNDDAGDSVDAESVQSDAAAEASTGEEAAPSTAPDTTDAAAETASGGATDESDDATTDGPGDDEAAVVSELMTTGQYRCQDCREAFNQDGPDLVCPDCGSTDIKERF
ncbi:hypothetical protein ACFQDG_11035 [Natronoarchaeum mannanilyticum]